MPIVFRMFRSLGRILAAMLLLTGVGSLEVGSVSNARPNGPPQVAAPSDIAVQALPSAVGQWSPPFSWPVVAIHTHVLPNGKVLAWQRKDSDLSTLAYLWDPNTGSFTPLFNPTTHLFCSGHAFLPNGRLLVTGGHHFFDGDGEPHTNIFDFNTNGWTRVADMNLGRWYPTSTTLPNGEILVVSGLFWNGALDPNGGHQHEVNGLPQVWSSAGNWRSLFGAQLMTMQLYPWMFVAPNGTVFNAGPDVTTSFLNTSGSGSWVPGPNNNFGFRDTGSAVMYDTGKILITGGGPPTNTAEVIDLNSPAPFWRTVAPMAFARRQMNATILADGKVLATGGTSGGGFNNAIGSVLAAEMWDPATESWSTMASMQVRRLYHSTAVLLPDGRVLSAGGGLPPGTGGDTDHPDAEIYSPPYLFRGPRPTITSAPAAVNYGQTFLVNTPDGASITKVTLIRLSSVTHAFNENQRINYLPFGSSINGLTMLAPPNANVCPPGQYMLFIVNASGVPSVARIISIPPVPVTTQPPIPETGARVARNADGRLEVFYRGSDNALYHNSQTSPASTTWTGPTSLGGILTSDPQVAINFDGRLEVFVRSSGNDIHHRWQLAAGTAGWSNWVSLGGVLTSDICIGTNSDGRLEIFGRGTDNALYRNAQLSPGNSAWTGWIRLGGMLSSSPVVASNTNGRLEVFARWDDNTLYHVWQDPAQSTGWSGWYSLGGFLTSGPAVARNLDGRLEVFVRGAGNAVYRNAQNSPGQNSWSGFSPLGGILTTTSAVGRNADGRLEIFGRGIDNALYHNWQISPGSSTWSGWFGLGGGLSSAPSLGINVTNTLDVFVRGTDNALHHRWQTTPNGPNWSAWTSLGGSLFSF